MSINNRKRARLKNEYNSHAYHAVLIKRIPFEDEMCHCWLHRSKGPKNIYKKQITHHQYRAYRTWKYNRLTQYKNGK